MSIHQAKEITVKQLKLCLYRTQEAKSETAITIPLSSLRVSMQFIPKKVKLFLEKEGIDLKQCEDLTKEKDLKGPIIEIETPSEKVVISVE
jgi:hypothetical protein